VNSTGNVRRLRKRKTKEEKQLWHALRAGRFAGFKFRRQHPLGPFSLDFYGPQARLSIELDGFTHGFPRQRQRDLARERFLNSKGIQELRFWNYQWRENREGVLLGIWDALHRSTGCVQILRKLQNQRYVPPNPAQIGLRPPKPLIWYPPGTEPET
jgi:very-short-patch-repair endonuclease